jgi:predicted RND superfamily exporter protein
MGRRRRDKNHSPQKDNSINDSVGNKENGYSIPDSNKTMINVTKETSNDHKENPQRGNLGRNH